MKNIKLFLTFLFIACVLLSCRKEEDPGGVAIGDMCGEWNVTIDGSGTAKIYTSNNVDNAPNKIIITDKLSYYWFTFEANVNTTTRTFAVDTAVNKEYYNAAWNPSNARNLLYDIKIIIRDGKVTKEAITLPSGVKADMIEFSIGFEDDGYTLHEIVGYRRSGYLEDEAFYYMP
jgi:hypothetical protein